MTPSDVCTTSCILLVPSTRPFPLYWPLLLFGVFCPGVTVFGLGTFFYDLFLVFLLGLSFRLYHDEHAC